jgi:hypothetical protein
MLRTTLLTFALTALAAAPAAAHSSEPTLKSRAILPADATWPAPFPGAPNTEPVPAPGSTQPVGGFSGLLKAPWRDGYLAMPDNGFGSKANSHSFLLRVYAVKPDWETAHGGGGTVQIQGAINLRDPNHKIPFKLVNEGTEQRYLTGGDFDIESFRIDRRGTLWFGEEFGPFLLHTDATGKVLEKPIPLPGVRSPDYPADYPPFPAPPVNLASSNGFEGMAISPDGRTLYPTLEGPLTDEADKTIRRSYTFDIASRRYEPGYRVYRVADPSYLVSDLTALDSKRFVSLERDNFQGEAAAHKRAFVVDARHRTLTKREVLNQLKIADPAKISLPARPGDIGLGNPFKMPYVTIEAVLPVGRSELAIVNDTNFGSTGRNPSLPDYSDFIRVRVPGLEGRH